MKKSLFALALLASAATTAFAHDGDKPAKGKKADHCTGMAAAKCEQGMAGYQHGRDARLLPRQNGRRQGRRARQGG